jgi:hypothetical protein
MRNIGSPYVDKGKLRTFFKKKHLCKKELGIAQPEQKLAKNIDRSGKKDTANYRIPI